MYEKYTISEELQKTMKEKNIEDNTIIITYCDLL